MLARGLVRVGSRPLAGAAAPPLRRRALLPGVVRARTFFGFGDKGDDGKDGKKKPPSGALEEDDQAASRAVADDSGASSVVPAVDDEVTSVGFGDAAPKPERVLALGLSRRPLFPGMIHTLSISRKAADAIAAERDAGRPYLGLFLRKDDPDQTSALHNEDAAKLLNGEDPALLCEIERAVQDDRDPLVAAYDAIYSTGTFAQLHNVQPTTDGRSEALVLVHRRVDLASIVDAGPPPRVGIRHWDREDLANGATNKKRKGGRKGRRQQQQQQQQLPGEEEPPSSKPTNEETIRALSNEIVAVIKELLQHNPLYRQHMQYFTQRVDMSEPYKLADFATALCTADGHELQKQLEERDVEQRLRLALELVMKERELTRLQSEISQQVESKISTHQRQILLQEQLKTIKKELGLETDDKEALMQKYRRRLDELEGVAVEEEEEKKPPVPEGREDSVIPREARRAIDEEMNKLSALEKNSSEFNVTRNYLDWLTSLPWGKHAHEKFDVEAASAILDEQHYGMEDVKERIMELVAVGNLVGEVRGKILCLVGPPGVGKTSIGTSIANALGREFYRFSVGGLSDVSEIKGHRRTYVGAMPGKPVQCLKRTQTNNPLILIDEVDKMGRGGHDGDPASALLELLDPSQNSSFLDHYLDVPVDFSRCLFVCTANVEHTIPRPLLDRMEVVRLAGYDLHEKLEIAKKYLVPVAVKEAGLDPVKTTLEDDALGELIRGHAREAGVRSLQKLVEKIARKLALKEVQRKTKGEEPLAEVVVNATNLEDYVGKPKFLSDRLYPEGTVPPGVVMGLAWTAMGGSTLYIEATSLGSTEEEDEEDEEDEGKKKKKSKRRRRGAPRFSTTGQLGSVMEESSRVAANHVRARLAAEAEKTDFAPGFEPPTLDGREIHVHVPEGATPKDGPSAGVTIATALVSLAKNQPVRTDLAMTGEISLTGRVLMIGGVKEKTIAARRAGVTHILLPADNRKDFDELADYLKEGLTPHFAATFDDVVEVAFADPGT